jgi:hypothetical protein
MSQIPDFQSGNIGLYKSGQFYSESYSGVPFESDLISPKGVGREDFRTPDGIAYGGVQRTMRLIVLLHETSHYVHDLSLGMPIEIDHLLDQSDKYLVSAVRRLISKEGTIHCPLVPHRYHERWARDKAIHKDLSSVEAIDASIGQLMGSQPNLPRDCTPLLPWFQDSQELLGSLSGFSLLESLVAVKTCLALFERIKGPADSAYLNEIKNEIPILPEKLPSVYNNPRRIFNQTIGVPLVGGAAIDEDDWPLDYLQSPRYLLDTAFIYVADIALHIPPSHYTSRLIEAGKNTAEDFIPAYRFCKAISVLFKNGGFPGDNNSDPTKYYNELFDFIATENGLNWPSIKATNQAWQKMLAMLKLTRKEAADGYRYRMITERDLRPHFIVMGSPLETCGGQFVPVYHLTPNGFKFLRLFIVEGRHTLVPVEIPNMGADEFFYVKYPLWKNMPSEWAWGDKKVMLNEAGNAQLLGQEIIYRSLNRERHQAILHKDHLSCPFAKQGCSFAVAGCAHITDMSTLPLKRCVLRDYMRQDRIDPKFIQWT